MNRTRGFVNLNRFKSGRAVKRLSKITYPQPKKKISGRNREAGKDTI